MQKNEILVIYGKNAREMVLELLESAGLFGLIGNGARVGIKPNLVVARPASQGATTHPEMVAGVVEYLQGHGVRDIDIIEGAWVGERTPAAFKACGMDAVAKKYGVRLVDTQRDSHRSHDCAGMPIEICDAALAVDFMINMPVMKGHCQTVLTCALKNNKGVIPDGEKRRFHTMGLHRPIAHLNTVAKNDFVLVDGICGDLDFEEGGNPVYAGRIFAARDPVLCDAWAAQQMGVRAEEVPYIGLAEALGVGRARVEDAVVRELNSGQAAGVAPRPEGKARRVAPWIEEDQACSACYAALVRALDRMDEHERRGLPGSVCIGQGFAGRPGDVGVGRCTAGFVHSLGGCPPSAGAMRAFLQDVARGEAGRRG